MSGDSDKGQKEDPAQTVRLRVRDRSAPPEPLAKTSDPPFGEDTTETTAETERLLSSPVSKTDERATLTIMTGMSAGQVFSVGVQSVIGRSHTADLKLDDPGVSRRHARIVRIAGRFVLEDLGSTNGTYVDGAEIQRTELASGSRIQVGPHVLLRFGLSDAAEEQLQRRLYESSTRDGLTRAYNRAHFMERLVAEVAHARRHRSQLSLLMMDLDRFKRVNDTYGHAAGDAVLRAVVDRTMTVLRMEDLLARYGGEEFAVLVRSAPLASAAVLAERVRVAIEELPVSLANGGTVHTTISIGAAALSEVDVGSGAQQLIALADHRLYLAKHGGRNRVCSQG